MITFSTAYDHFNDLSLAHSDDPVERVRYAGYAVMMHDLLMMTAVSVNIAKLYRAEGLDYHPPVVDTQHAAG